MTFTGLTLLIVAAVLSNVDATYDENEGRPKKEIDAFRIKMSERTDSYTSGSLQIGMLQGTTICTTSQELLSRPYAMNLYVIAERSKFGQCIGKLFKLRDRNNPIQLRVLSNSNNNAYLEKVGVKLGGEWYDWTGFEVMVDHGDPTDWQTVYKSGIQNGSAIQEIAIQMSNTYHASTGGKLRVEVKQGSHTDCETATNLLIAPRSYQFYRITDKGKFGSCIETKFNPRDGDNIQIRVLSSSSNNAYIDSVKVMINGKWYGWTGTNVMVDYGDPTDWRNVHKMAM